MQRLVNDSSVFKSREVPLPLLSSSEHYLWPWQILPAHETPRMLLSSGNSMQFAPAPCSLLTWTTHGRWTLFTWCSMSQERRFSGPRGWSARCSWQFWPLWSQVSSSGARWKLSCWTLHRLGLEAVEAPSAQEDLQCSTKSDVEVYMTVMPLTPIRTTLIRRGIFYSFLSFPIPPTHFTMTVQVPLWPSLFWYCPSWSSCSVIPLPFLWSHVPSRRDTTIEGHFSPTAVAGAFSVLPFQTAAYPSSCLLNATSFTSYSFPGAGKINQGLPWVIFVTSPP